MKINVNGQQCEAQAGESILDLCRREGIPIPTFCYHQAFGGQGACRMCMVEIQEEGQADTRLVAACTYLLTKPVEITTESAQILRIRRTIAMLLTRRADKNPRLEEMCRNYGATRMSALAVEPANCILCGLCIHACTEMGRSAIWSMFRGVDKRIATPYDEASDDCMGCTACARVCPTQAIVVEEEGTARRIWGKSFALVACRRCGKPYATKEELDYLLQHSDFGQEELCEICRRKALATSMKTFRA